MKNKNRAVGIREVAARADVAAITVSRVLREPEKVKLETRLRVERAIKELNFIPNLLAGGLSASRSRIVSVITPTIKNATIAQQVQGISDAFANSGYEILLATSNFSPDNELAIVKALAGWKPAGIIISAPVELEETRKILQSLGAPVVEVNEIEGFEPIDYAVGISHRSACGDITKHLIERGNRRIVFVGIDPKISYRSRRRLLGFRETIDSSKFEIEAQEIFGPDTAQFGAEVVRDIFARKLPADALLFTNDATAHGALLECRKQGISVPTDIAISGFEDAELSELLVPPLTSVHYPLYEIGRVAATVLLSHLSGKEQHQKRVELPYRLSVREST